MVGRMDLLKELVGFERNLDEISSELAVLSWDYEGEPFDVNAAHIKEVLQRYISGEITATDVEKWANLIESREDIAFEKFEGEELKNVIYRLANPVLEGEITNSSCKQLIAEIDRKN